MPDFLDRFFDDLDREKLRVKRPSAFIFFCGGAIPENTRSASSLRHYLLENRGIGRRLKADIVLAEAANQLYRDTTYKDLITFEEDIAKISAMVLVIAESAGSLAELGAFASSETLSRSLTILMQEEYAESESFIRYGPVQRIRNDDQERVAFFPWRLNGNSKIIKSSASPHVGAIVSFINERLKKVPKTTKYSEDNEFTEFVLLYWVLYLSIAMPLGKLTSYITNIVNGLDDRAVRRKLYCMQLAGWVDKIHYSNLDYYYCRYDIDPLDYSFREGVNERDSVRRKADIAVKIQNDLSLPRHVRGAAAEQRKLPPR